MHSLDSTYTHTYVRTYANMYVDMPVLDGHGNLPGNFPGISPRYTVTNIMTKTDHQNIKTIHYRCIFFMSGLQTLQNIIILIAFLPFVDKCTLVHTHEKAVRNEVSNHKKNVPLTTEPLITTTF